MSGYDPTKNPSIEEAIAQLRAIVSRLDHATLSALIETAIARLDELDGDADAEDGDEAVIGGRLGDHPWIDEDAEDSDSDRCLAGDDGVFAGPAIYSALGFGDDPAPTLLDDDCEIETWSHHDDHPAELFIHNRPGSVARP